MKVLFLLLVFPIITGNQCCNNKSTSNTGNSMPDCIKKMTTGDNAAGLPLQIDEFEYKGKKVFYVTEDCCDKFNTVYDENCNAICAPSGGLDGNGDRRCPDFDSSAKHIKKIWTKK